MSKSVKYIRIKNNIDFLNIFGFREKTFLSKILYAFPQ